MATATNSKAVRVIGILAILAGVLMIVAGGVTWITVRGQLVAEDITIPDDAAAFQGNTVNGPIDAYIQAQTINKHALSETDGQTYAQLDREDPARATVATASFLRTSLFSSVIAFGVAAFAGGVGLLMILMGWALMKLAPAPVVVAPATTRVREDPVA